MTSAKAFARHLYATVPGLAAARFALKNVSDRVFRAADYAGVGRLLIGQGLIVDIGANRGQSITMLQHYAKNARIVAFEPGPTSRALRIKYSNNASVYVYDNALADKPGLTTMFTPKYGFWECDGMTATTYEEATEWMHDPNRLYKFDPRKLRVSPKIVDCFTLDSFDLEPALIKIHAQGAEYDIILGAKSTLRRHAPRLMIAFPTQAVVALLYDLGYNAFVYERGRFRSGINTKGTFTFFFRSLR